MGAGPVGLFTALKLCRANLPVTVIEKVTKHIEPNLMSQEEQVLNTPHAIAYAYSFSISLGLTDSPPCVAELDRVGILEDVIKIGRLGYW